jgi:sulfur relay (sulfurtransferase) DsrC/TusE family protein
MAKTPLVAELEFIKLTNNHAEFSRVLRRLNLQDADVLEYAQHVAKCWYSLAEEHLVDAKSALQNNRIKATYSRAYYAAYNASKAARYVVTGGVSLKGDDHKLAASALPKDIPDVENGHRQSRPYMSADYLQTMTIGAILQPTFR